MRRNKVQAAQASYDRAIQRWQRAARAADRASLKAAKAEDRRNTARDTLDLARAKLRKLTEGDWP